MNDFKCNEKDCKYFLVAREILKTPALCKNYRQVELCLSHPNEFNEQKKLKFFFPYFSKLCFKVEFLVLLFRRLIVMRAEVFHVYLFLVLLLI
jgi:hypothetical protein